MTLLRILCLSRLTLGSKIFVIFFKQHLNDYKSMCKKWKGVLSKIVCFFAPTKFHWRVKLFVFFNVNREQPPVALRLIALHVNNLTAKLQ